ncbi:diguanylate cyclase [Daeguia caeni]|uniref:Diguanylate cyclase n=2 Tax=Daeguia caeni TaxID=439612 RepID=A0ABV9H7U9_9HYPH
MATDKTYALVMSGLDCFKQINDQYGHDGGDRVIAAFDVS